MICIVTSFYHEAKPIIGHFKLKKQTSDSSFTTFENSEIKLIVTGPGKINAAIATSHLATTLSQNAIFMNIGVASHPTYDVGEGFFASSIRDNSSGKAHHADFTALPGVAHAPLITLENPPQIMKEEALHEMEAFGFFEGAKAFTSIELIQVYKIISSNHQCVIPKKNKGFVQSLIKEHIPLIETSINRLEAQLLTLPEAPVLDHVVNRWNFTGAQIYQLQSAMERMMALNLEDCLPGLLQSSEHANSFLQHLNSFLDSQTLIYD